MAKPIETVFRDHSTEGNPSTAAHEPIKADIRDLHNAHLFNLTGALSGAIVKSSLSDLNGDLAHAADTLAWVIGDSTQGNDGVYQKQSASGAGSWTRLKDLPYSVIQLNNANAGTANAIQATTAINVPDASYGALLILNITEANTGAVTLSVNGGTPKPIVTNTNAAIVSGYFSVGMAVLCVDDGTSYRLMSYGDASAAQAAAESAQAAAAISAAVVASMSEFSPNADGTTNDDAAFTSAEGSYPNVQLNLGGSSYAISSLPYPNTPDATEPIYTNGYLVVSGVTYPTHGLGSIISDTTEVPEMNTAHRGVLIGSDRSSVGRSADDRHPNAIIASTRSHSECNRGAVIGGQWQQIYGAFANVSVSSRESQMCGEQGTLASSRLCRIHGSYGANAEDDGNLFGKTSEDTFYSSDSNPTSNSETYRNAIFASLGVDIIEGSDNVVIASRGENDLSSGLGVVEYPLQIDGSRILVGASQGDNTTHSRVAGDGIAVLASQKMQVEDGAVYSGMIASRECTINSTADMSFIGGCELADIHGGAQAIIASTNARINATGTSQSAIIASSGTGGSNVGVSASNRSILAASRNVEVNSSDSLVLGYTSAAISLNGSDQNHKIRLEANGGVGRFSGGTSTSGLDYAEYFENLTLGEIDFGEIIVFELGSRKVRIGKSSDKTSQIIGVLSSTPSVIGNAADFEWDGKYVRDEWGVLQKKSYDLVTWNGVDTGKEVYNGRVSDVEKIMGISAQDIPEHAEFFQEEDLIISENWDESQAYTPRKSRRDQYSLVGMVGQLLTRVGESVESGNYVGADGEKSDTPTKIICMEIVSNYSADKGFAQAWCKVG